MFGGKGGSSVTVSIRKVLALSFSSAYIFMTIVCLWYDKEVPTEFIAIVSTVVGYYFGKSTALDMPSDSNNSSTNNTNNSSDDSE